MLQRDTAISVGVAIRAALFLSSNVQRWLISRPEISTPQSSWMRMKEGISLLEHNIPIYSGDSYHDTPLMLHLFCYIKDLSPILFPVVFIMADVFAAWNLHAFAKVFIDEQTSFYHANKQHYAKDSHKMLVKKNRREWIPDLLCLLYMMNPFIIGTCVAKSSIVFNNLFLASMFYHSVKGNTLQVTLFLALSTYQTLYPVQLLAPVIFCCQQVKKDAKLTRTLLRVVFLFVFWITLLLGMSYLSCKDFSFFATYKFILSVPDLTPNVGIFWYFFTEVFEHFHMFFLCVFQLNVLIFSIPLTIKLRSRPVFMMFILCYIIATFKSYPCVSDAGFCLCLLPVWSYSYKYLRFPLVTCVMLLVSTVLCPIMWHLWILAGSANANFYFAATLTYCTANVLIMTDIVVSYLRYEFHLHEGLEPKVEGTEKPALIRLKN